MGIHADDVSGISPAGNPQFGIPQLLALGECRCTTAIRMHYIHLCIMYCLFYPSHCDKHTIFALTALQEHVFVAVVTVGDFETKVKFRYVRRRKNGEVSVYSGNSMAAVAEAAVVFCC